MSLAPVISPEDAQRARNHMGYGGVSQTGTFQIGIPAATQTSFMIETSLANMLPEALDGFLRTLERLDVIEEDMFGNFDAHTVSKIGNIEINDKAFQRKLRFYRHWQGTLANILQCPPNPYDQRPGLGPGWGNGGGGINVGVEGG